MSAAARMPSRVFDEQGDSFSVALLDIMMPGIDGFAVCKHIREKNIALGIIMLSAKSQEMDKVNGLMLAPMTTSPSL